MFSPHALKVKLKEESEKLGFDGFGVCSAEDFSSAEAAELRCWLDKGMNDKMEYLERAFEKKISPRKYFPQARCVVCLAANFYRPSPESRIALYAQSEDYHKVIKPKLEKLALLMSGFGGEQKVCIDASPLWEKQLARRAGLGWIGKNTLVLRELNGPWSFIGLILTSLDLPLDSEIPNLCGQCTRCVDACPNGALTDIGLDARKCISNLTIERKPPLPETERKMCADKIFGCDICLRACPFTPKTRIGIMRELDSRIVLPPSPSPDDIARVSEGTPVQRMLRRKQ